MCGWLIVRVGVVLRRIAVGFNPGQLMLVADCGNDEGLTLESSCE